MTMISMSLSPFTSKLRLCGRSVTVCTIGKRICPPSIASSLPASSEVKVFLHTSRLAHCLSLSSCVRGVGASQGNSFRSFQSSHASLCNIFIRSFATATRRRRIRGGRPSTQPSGDSPSDITKIVSGNKNLSQEKFRTLGTELLDKFEKSLLKLKDSNDGLEIVRSPPDYGGESHGGRLSVKVTATEDLYWGGGTYILTIHPENNNVTLLSPLSGNFTYVHDVDTGEWVGSDDGHSLLGMFTRDWIRQCNGVPDF
mmetsp:Transcript_7245/g.15160  ORF Transcript_7245/g.15160 Transcript_7245/m.15160 type:complete len:255 (+) Transcript_7245:60-824(+)